MLTIIHLNTFINDPNTAGKIVLLSVIGMVSLLWFLSVAWEESKSDAIRVRTMKLNRWNFVRKEYNNFYFIEWEYEYKEWFMGFKIKSIIKFNEANYRDFDGHTTLQDAKIEIKNVLTDYIKDIEVIEVFDVKDELSKINII